MGISNKVKNSQKTVHYNGVVSSLKEWDANGNQTTSIEYYEDGTVSYECEFDNNGNVVRETWYNEDGSVNWIEEY